MQESGSTASLRGIFSVDGKVAWASGTEGTVLRTLDSGAHWTKCAVPDAASDGATLDFRGVQAWDKDTAIVMASGPGEKSRLYKTTDGCGTWGLIFRNPDAPDGFFDSFWLNAIYGEGMLVGDPVKDNFTVFMTEDGGQTWKRDENKTLSLHGILLAAFAASNSSIARDDKNSSRGFVTGGKAGAFLFQRWSPPHLPKSLSLQKQMKLIDPDWTRHFIPLAAGVDSTGAYSLGYRLSKAPPTEYFLKGSGGGYVDDRHFIAVGGDYLKPNESAGTAALSADSGWTWTASIQPPHGYRSAVQWSEALRAWVTVGTNGSDFSRDDSKTWKPLDDGEWNALSLPFVVGPKGRIARLMER